MAKTKELIEKIVEDCLVNESAAEMNLSSFFTFTQSKIHNAILLTSDVTEHFTWLQKPNNDIFVCLHIMERYVEDRGYFN